MAKRNALGKGLGALLDNVDTDITSGSVHRSPNTVAMIPISAIVANPFQPRTEFEQVALEELSESIRVHGIIQPVTVRKIGVDQFELISGERRTRAAIMAGLTELPAYIRLANDQEMLEMALIENIQREDLNAIEVSLSYRRLLEECGLKQEELGQRVGKKRSTVNNYLRLLKLPDEIQLAIQEGTIAMGHARALINIEDPTAQLRIFNAAVENGLSVRQVEEMVRNAYKRPADPEKPERKEPVVPDTRTLDTFDERIEGLIDQFGSKIEFRKKKDQTGSIVIHFKSKNELEAILEKLENS
ncbi:MAG: ParB/RepB/Spo0J family partition protein [Flavobacteriales bacterium]|nr:ParB/RepB/Spo0J family partition protein [Flavobacteriales bacterium]